MDEAKPTEPESEPKAYERLSWEQASAGVYFAVGGRFKISRRGTGNWILTDNNSGQQMRFGVLRDAQHRAELILNEKL